VTDYDWEPWLREWSRTLLERVDPSNPASYPDEDLTPEMVASGWLGAPGAGESRLAALEARLGVTLPPSYRSFLGASNGFLQPGVLVPRLLPAEEVDWFRSAHQDVIAAWNVGTTLGLGRAAADPEAFEHYLPTALQVSDLERAGTAVYLLNPKVVDTSGEWEAFYFAHWIPGVNRYPSFRALMEDERTNWSAPEPRADEPASRPSPARSYWETLKWIFRGG
jgi:hypothetical protein